MYDLHELYPYTNAVDLGGSIRSLLWNNAALIHAREYLLLSGSDMTVNEILNRVGEPQIMPALLYGAAHAADAAYTVTAFLQDAEPEKYEEYSHAVVSGLIHLMPDADAEPDDDFEDADLYPKNQLQDKETVLPDWREILLCAMRLGFSYGDFLQTSPRAILTLVGVNTDSEGSGEWL